MDTLKNLVMRLQNTLEIHGDMQVWVKYEDEYFPFHIGDLRVALTDTFNKRWLNLSEITEEKLLLIDMDSSDD